VLVEYKPNVKWGLCVGLFLQVSCGSLLAWRIYSAPDQDAITDTTNLTLALVLLGGVYCWALGCGDYARGKGHDVSVGSLLSLLSLPGLFILWVLPDRHPFDAFGPRRLVPTAVPPSEVPAPPPVPGADPAGSRWYYAKTGEALGPLAEPALIEMARSGYLKRSDLVWKSGLQNWLPAESQFGGVFNQATQPIPAPPALPPAPPPLQAPVVQAEVAALSVALTRSAPKLSVFSWTVALPVGLLVVFGLTVLLPWRQYAERFWPTAVPKTAPQKVDPPEPAAPAQPAPQPPQTMDATKPAQALEQPIPPAPPPAALPAGTVTGTYQRIDPAPVNNPKTHASSYAELQLQQVNPRLLQFDVRFQWTTAPHVRTMERELKGVARGQGDSFVYDYVNPVGARAAAAGHCLEIHFQQGNTRLIVPPDAPDACLDASGMAGLYARTASAQPGAPDHAGAAKKPSF